jgi:hypothetical protein
MSRISKAIVAGGVALVASAVLAAATPASAQWRGPGGGGGWHGGGGPGWHGGGGWHGPGPGGWHAAGPGWGPGAGPMPGSWHGPGWRPGPPPGPGWGWRPGYWNGGVWYNGWWAPALAAGLATGAIIATAPAWGGDNCWQNRPVYDANGNWLGNRNVDVCQ